jgi:cytochrome o ubiquinol oxidase subunit 1
MKEKGEAYVKPAKYEEIHMPRNSGMGFVIAMLSLVCGFALIWDIWWLALVAFIGIVVSWIVKSFDEDVDYYVSVEEIERIEKQHFEQISKAGVKHGN